LQRKELAKWQGIQKRAAQYPTGSWQPRLFTPELHLAQTTLIDFIQMQESGTRLDLTH